MGDVGAYLAIVVALLLGAMSPGPSFIVTARTALGGSRTAGLRVALGLGLGGLLFALLALVGLIALLSTVEWLFALVKIAGALYLVYLAVRLWRGARAPVDVDDSGRSRTVRSDVLRGFVVQVSNPKTAVVYTSVFAAALPPSPSLWLSVGIATSVFAIEAGWYSFVALGFSTARLRGSYARAKVWVDRSAAVLLGGLGARLILTAGSRSL
jgi:threonine/homoserine/homoserine lactone efflux protein